MQPDAAVLMPTRIMSPAFAAPDTALSSAYAPDASVTGPSHVLLVASYRPTTGKVVHPLGAPLVWIQSG